MSPSPSSLMMILFRQHRRLPHRTSIRYASTSLLLPLLLSILISCDPISGNVVYNSPPNEKIKTALVINEDVPTVWKRLIKKLLRKNFFINSSTIDGGHIKLTLTLMPPEKFITCGNFDYSTGLINSSPIQYNPLTEGSLTTDSTLSGNKTSGAYTVTLSGRANISITPRQDGTSTIHVNVLFDLSSFTIERSNNLTSSDKSSPASIHQSLEEANRTPLTVSDEYVKSPLINITKNTSRFSTLTRGELFEPLTQTTMTCQSTGLIEETILNLAIPSLELTQEAEFSSPQ